MPDCSFSKVLGLMFVARSYLWKVRLNDGARDDYAMLGIGERLLTRNEAEALLRNYRHSLRNMR